MRRLVTLAGAVLLLAAAGCAPSSVGQERGPGAESDGTSVGSDARRGPVPRADDVTSRDDLTDERIVWWRRARAVGSQGVRVTVTFGTPDCYGVRTVVLEDDDRVALATVEGALPGGPMACTLDAVIAKVLVPLDAPLGDRRVVRLPAAEVDLR